MDLHKGGAFYLIVWVGTNHLKELSPMFICKKIVGIYVPWAPGSEANPKTKCWSNRTEATCSGQSYFSGIVITGLKPRVQMDMVDRIENFVIEAGATYSVIIVDSGSFSQFCATLGATGDLPLKWFTPILFCWWDGLNIHLQVPGGPWMPHSLIRKGNTQQSWSHNNSRWDSWPKTLQSLVLGDENTWASRDRFFGMGYQPPALEPGNTWTSSQGIPGCNLT